MTRHHFSSGSSFRTKMLVAVTIVTSLLVAVSLWLVSQRFKQQIHNNAADQLRMAEGVLKIRQQTRSAELFLRFNVANNEPKFKAAAALLSDRDRLTPEGLATIRQTLQQMMKAVDADLIVLTPAGGGRDVSESRDPQFDSQAIGGQCAGLIRQALNGQALGGMITAGGQLFDVVTLPIRLGGDSSDVVGSITFGVANSMASEFKQSMSKDDDLVLLLDNKVVASTIGHADPAMPAEFSRLAATSGSGWDMQEIVLGDEHFWGLAGWLGSEGGSSPLGYLILSSWEKPLQELYSIEQSILLIGLAAVICGIAVVWLLVRKITEPLRDLQESAAAVGRGDFSRHVDIRTNDEFGKLGQTFNEMTRDIERSHSELHQTVNTLKSTQAQLVQSEKLSAVGEFVAGVAHELNNPLAAVIGFSEILKDADVGPENRQHLDLIFKSSLRCRKIVQSLLSFARRHQPERKPVSVNKLIEEVLEIVAYQLKTSNVKVVTRFGVNLPLVLADGHQIQQVVLNLINNARQAIEAHQASGCITITSELRETVVRVSIQDDGPGIAPENLSRIFDPFFTTKEVGKGTGLGLSLCYGLIREHGGNVSVTSEPGNGATFTIELPVTAGAASADIVSAADDGLAKSNEGAGKTVLLVDDEEILLEMIQNGLKRHGYEIITANNGEAALKTLHEHRIDVVCTDIKMPGMNGRQLYDWIRNSRPAVARRVIFMTGDVINRPLQLFLEQEQLVCLHKPFAMADLRKAIQKVLEENKGVQAGPRV